MAIDFEYYLAQTRRIAKHREDGAEKQIRSLYKSMLKDLQTFVSETYVQYAEDDKLTFAMLQKAGYDARFLEEIEQHISVATPKAAKELRKLVQETYKIAYDGMVEAVTKEGNLDEAFAEAVAITPHQIKNVVKNPIMEVALEKNHKDIIYDIKQVIAIGLMNGDRYTTMARRIADQVDGSYKKAIRIARTEAHRVREAGNIDAATEADKELQAGTTGMRMVKTWKTMKDERVRPQRRRRGKRSGWSTTMGKGANHMRLDGQVVLADEDFDLLDGNKAPAPGQSGIAGHDINCRCYASYEMMDDEEFFVATGRHFPGYKGKEKQEKPAQNFKPAATIDEAREYARNRLGLNTYNWDSRLNIDVANMINKELTTIYNVFGNVHTGGHLDAIHVMTGRKSFVAAYSASFKEISLLKSNVGYKNSIKKMAEMAQQQHKLGFWSTGDAEHFVRHEAGHAIQHWLTDNNSVKLNKISVLRQQVMKDCGITRWSACDTKENMTKAGNVLSYYALQTNGEFIAESIAEYIAGNPRSMAKKVVKILLEGR